MSFPFIALTMYRPSSYRLDGLLQNVVEILRNKSNSPSLISIHHSFPFTSFLGHDYQTYQTIGKKCTVITGEYLLYQSFVF